MKFPLYRLFATVLCSVLLAACMGPETPEEVTSAFWLAVRDHDQNDIASLSTLENPAAAKFRDQDWNRAIVTLGKIVVDGDQASITTRITGLDNNKQGRDLTTYLVRQQDRWLVDFDATRQSLEQRSLLNGLLDRLSKLGNSLSDQFNQSSSDWTAQMEQLSSELEDISRDARAQADEMIEDYSDQLEQQIRELEKSLDEALKQQPDNSTDRQLLEASVEELQQSRDQLDDNNLSAVTRSRMTLERIRLRLDELQTETLRKLGQQWQRTLDKLDSQTEQWGKDLQRSI
ncbi:hypothetical protein [Oceanobacter mangrovi]|uniref:hypothetical protein n=1 Tax=Oceanobacter mangrovi TaxID=2862510 RepID=UPI001C8DC1A5|nr:hypothetical protein [Oceanobacter mangrovi]